MPAPQVPSMSTIGANDLTEEGRRTVVITIVFTVLATVAVIARFWARFLSALTLQVEDWLIFGGLIFTWGYAAGNIIFAYNGLGVASATLIVAGRMYQLQNQLKLLIANQVTYAIALGLVKTSILLTLIRIFHVFKKFRILGYCAIAFCVCWSIQTILIAFLICTPLSYNWDQINQTGHCGNLTVAYVSIGIVDVISDIIIFALPIPFINGLKMRRSSKWAAMGLFALGIFTVTAGAVRTGMILRVQFDPTDPEGPTQNLIWAAIEPCVAIIVTSLLVVKPLIVFVHRRLSGIVSTLSGSSGAQSSRPSANDRYASGDRIVRSKKGFTAHKNESERELQAIDSGKIWQTTEVHVDEYPAARTLPRNVM